MTFEDFFEEWGNDKDYILSRTSGSTGTPKEIRLPKRLMEESGLRTNIFFGLGQGSRFHSCVAPDFIGGKMMAVRAIISDGKLTWETPSNRPLKCLTDPSPIDLLAVVPSQMLHLLENLNSIPPIRSIIVGGSAIHPELRRKIANSGLNVYETYGMTETASHIALRKIRDEETPFKLLPGIEIDVDEDSCLKIKFPDGYEVLTNDIAALISKDQFFIKGRRDNIIITGGKKVNPFDLETKISPFIKSNYFIAGVADEKWGNKIVLVIEASPESYDKGKLMESIESVLPRWQIPKEIIFKSRFQYTPNGKILRQL